MQSFTLFTLLTRSNDSGQLVKITMWFNLQCFIYIHFSFYIVSFLNFAPTFYLVFYAPFAKVSPQVGQHCGDILQTRVPVVYSKQMADSNVSTEWRIPGDSINTSPGPVVTVNRPPFSLLLSPPGAPCPPLQHSAASIASSRPAL